MNELPFVESSLSNALPLDVLAFPSDHQALKLVGDVLVCPAGHTFQVQQGIPLFAAKPRREPVPGNMHRVQNQGFSQTAVDPFVDDWIVNTNGNLYWPVRGKLPRYPIPEWPLPAARGKSVVDVGCSWGRWSAAAPRSGYEPIGLDVHVDGLAAAQRVTAQLELSAFFVCGDADSLPLRSNSMDAVFSYSVLQHLERSTVLRFFSEAYRVLKPEGICLVQLPNRFGLISLLQQLRRGFPRSSVRNF